MGFRAAPQPICFGIVPGLQELDKRFDLLLFGMIAENEEEDQPYHKHGGQPDRNISNQPDALAAMFFRGSVGFQIAGHPTTILPEQAWERPRPLSPGRFYCRRRLRRW